MSPGSGRLFYWAGAVFGILLDACVILMTLAYRGEHLALNSEMISVPRQRVWQKGFAISNEAISQLRIARSNRERVLEITHSGGKAKVYENYLPKKSELDEVVRFLRERVDSSKWVE